MNYKPLILEGFDLVKRVRHAKDGTISHLDFLFFSRIKSLYSCFKSFCHLPPCSSCYLFHGIWEHSFNVCVTVQWAHSTNNGIHAFTNNARWQMFLFYLSNNGRGIHFAFSGGKLAMRFFESENSMYQIFFYWIWMILVTGTWKPV